jgi:hypothetical protein
MTEDRIVIMPPTVRQCRENLQIFSAIRSFEQAHYQPIRPARHAEVHDLGAALEPYLSWCSSRISASAVMSASSSAPCRSSLSLVSRTSRSHIEESDFPAPGQSCANKACVQM